MSRRTRVRRAALAFCSLAVAGAGVPSLARADDSTDGESARLEEIVVSARRREENLQSVPIAVTVVSQETLQDNNVKTFEELQYLVPSMSSSLGLARDQISLSIRGQGANASGLAGVIAYINDVPIPDFDGSLVGGPGLFFDLENIQVLKGPQGTLFGRNSVGGALLLQTARPKNEVGGRLQVTAGNYDNREIDGAINLPIVSDTLLARIAVNGQVRDGFTRLQGMPGHPDGIDGDNREYWSVRGTVTFRPGEVFENDLITTFSKYTSHGSPQFLTDVDPNGLFATRYPGYYDAFLEQQRLGVRTALPVDVRYVNEGTNLSINNVSRVTISDTLTFRNILGFDVASQTLAKDSDNTVFPIAAIPSAPSKSTIRQFTEELQLLGESFDRRLNWITGAFFLDQAKPSEFQVQQKRLFGFPNDTASRTGAKSKAVFAQGTYDLAPSIPNLKLTAGARYTWDERAQEARGGVFGTSCVPPISGCDVTINRQKSSKALTWTFGLDYQIVPETLLYLTSRRGYRAGGYNDPGQPGFDPEYVTDLELGFKSDWNLGGLPIRVNADIYGQRYNDIQTSQAIASTTQLTRITANAARARIWGVEIESLAQLTRDLQVGINFNSLSYKYTEFEPGVDGAQLDATRLTNRPPRKYGVTARYDLPVAPDVGNISIRGSYNWQARSTTVLFSAADALRPSAEVPAYGLANLSINWDEIAGSPVSGSVFASNLTDKVYSVVGGGSAYTQIGYVNGMYGEPRMYGVRVSYRFGAEAR